MKEIKWPLTLIHISGHTLEIHDLESAISFMRHYGAWAENHRTWIASWLEGIGDQKVEYPWIARDSLGQKILAQDVVDAKGWTPYKRYNQCMAEVRAIAEKGLPIPGTGRGKRRRHNGPAKKNSGSGHYNRNISRMIEDHREYGIKSRNGYHMRTWF